MQVDASVTSGRSTVLALAVGALVALTLALAGAASVRALGLPTAGSWGAGAAALLGLTVAALVGDVRGRRPKPRAVTVDSTGLRLDGALVVPRQAIAHAQVIDDAGRTVRVTCRGLRGTQTLVVGSRPEAAALVEALERGPAALAEFDALPPWAHRMRWIGVVLTTSPWIVLNLLRFLPSYAVAVVVGLYALLGLPALVPRKITVGEDGVLLRWAGHRRFVPFATIAEARATPLGVALDLRSGEGLEIRVGHRPDAHARTRAAMLARIEEGLAAQRRLTPADDEDRLARGERDLATWIQESRALGRSDAGSYRALALPRERLWAVLENPSATLSAREGAALALRAELAEDERERLVRIAEKSASPRLRVALERVAGDADDAELRTALALEEDDAMTAATPLTPRRARTTRS